MFRKFYKYIAGEFKEVPFESLKKGDIFYHDEDDRLYQADKDAVPEGHLQNAKIECHEIDGIPIPF